MWSLITVLIKLKKKIIYSKIFNENAFLINKNTKGT